MANRGAPQRDSQNVQKCRLDFEQVQSKWYLVVEETRINLGTCRVELEYRRIASNGKDMAIEGEESINWAEERMQLIHVRSTIIRKLG